jgi:hypothetical protein
LPISEGERVLEPPEQIRWNRVSTLSEGAKVYVGGVLKMQDGRLTFVSTKERPLMVIFYNCREEDLTDGIIRAARTRNEYWNTITPISLVIGALALIYFASTFLNRPAFRLTVITSLIAIFIPLLPMLPPGLLLTAMYRRFAWHARRLRAYWDIARLPMLYLKQGEETSILSTKEKYGFIKLNSIPPQDANGQIPFLIPENTETEKTGELYFFGILDESSSLPQKSKDPFVSYGILPANPLLLARSYAIKAYTMETFAWLLLIAGILINIVFIFLILFLLRGI